MSTGDRFSEPKYVDWLKVNISLLYTKEALETFTDDGAAQLFQKLKSSIEVRDPPNCHTCTKEVLRKQWRSGRFFCHGGICDQWLAGLQDKHTHTTSQVEWGNVYVSRLPDDPWECAKLFMPFGRQASRAARDVDIAAFITLYQSCKYFHQFFQNPLLLGKIKDIRNRMMHCGSMEVEADQMQEDVGVMIQLLEDPAHLARDSHCKEAVSKINELQSGRLELTLNKELELKVLNAKLAAIESKADHLHHSYDELDEQVQTVVTDVEALDQLKDDYREMCAEVQATKSQLQVMTTIFTKCFSADELDGIDTDRISSSLNKVLTLDGQLGHLKASLVKQEREVQQQGRSMQAIEEDVVVMKDEQKAIKRKLEDTEAAIEAKLPRQSTEAEQLQNLRGRLLDVYSEHCQRIPVYPLRPTWKHPLEQLYVQQNMRIVDHRGKREDDLVSSLHQHDDVDNSVENNKSESKVRTLRDIFYSDRKRCKRIYVTGESGVGKSTFCEHLVSVWCKAHSVSQGTKHTEDEETMKAFDVLFYVRLNNSVINAKHSPTHEISTLIEHQLELKDIDVDHFLTNERTLVLMDSLDEHPYNSLPRSRMNYKCSVLITSRPWKIESLRNELEGQIDKQVEISELENDVSNNLADNVTFVLNKEYNKQKTGNDFMDQMEGKGIKKFLHVPVILVQMLCLWYDGLDIGNSLCQIYTNLIHHLIIGAVKDRPVPAVSGSETQEFPFNCSLKKCVCKRFNNLLWKIAKLAYDSLFREMPIVLDHDETEINDLSESEVELCLKMGILTQHKIFGKVTQLQKSVEFAHSSYKDFFASIHLTKEHQNNTTNSGVYGFIPASLRRLLANVLAYINIRPRTGDNGEELEACRRLLTGLVVDLDHALEIEKLILFTSGINSQIAELMTEILTSKASADKRIQSYRTSCKMWRQAPNAFLVKKIQDIILQGLKEARDGNNSKVTFSLHDVRIDWRNVDRILPHLTDVDTTRVKSIAINAEHDVSEKVWGALKQSNHVEKLQLCHNSATRILKTVTDSFQSLHTLNIDDVDMTSLDSKVEEIIQVPHLKSLGIGSRALFEHAQIEILCKVLSIRNTLKELRLHGLACRTHEMDKDNCLYQLNLSNEKHIEILQLRQLSLNKLTICPDNLQECEIRCLKESAAISAITDMSKSKTLSKLECWDLQGQDATNKLVEVLPQLGNLHRLVFWGIDFSNHDKVQLSPTMNNLQVVKLWSKVTMPVTAFRALLDSLPAHGVKVEIGGPGVCPVILKGGDVTEDIIKHIKECPTITIIEDTFRVEEDDGNVYLKSLEFLTNTVITIT